MTGPSRKSGCGLPAWRRSDGHLVTIPNGELANGTIHNIAKRPFIRRNLTLGLTYDTSQVKVRQAKEILEELLKDHEGLDPRASDCQGSFQRFLGFLNGPEMHLLVSPLPTGTTWSFPRSLTWKSSPASTRPESNSSSHADHSHSPKAKERTDPPWPGTWSKFFFPRFSSF